MAKVAVYCGASMPKSESLHYLATDIGAELARRNHTIIYGGSSKGLMGLVANGAIQMGGHVIGLSVPQLAGQEPPLQGVQMATCDTLSQRLYLFRRMADAHIVLPGGTGTLEELASAFNAICFNYYGVDVLESMLACPIYLVDDPEGLNSRLYAYLESVMEEGLINAELFPHIQLKSMTAIMASLPKTKWLQSA